MYDLVELQLTTAWFSLHLNPAADRDEALFSGRAPKAPPTPANCQGAEE